VSRCSPRIGPSRARTPHQEPKSNKRGTVPPHVHTTNGTRPVTRDHPRSTSGRVYFNTRNDSPAPGTRADAYSRDGGESLVKPFRPQAGLIGPVVQGSVLQLRDPDLLLHSGPADPGFRALMTVRASTDHGVTWRTAHTVDGLPAAYSDLVRVDEETVGLLYETGDFSAYETITFRRIPLSHLTRAAAVSP
jgi:sialidase-1